MMASWAISRSVIACWTKVLTPGIVEGFSSSMYCISMGMYSQLSSKEGEPSRATYICMLELSANSVIGSFTTQSFWSDCTIAHSICTTFLMVLSKAPSVCRWNAVDMRSLAPSIQCSLHQNVNLASRETIVSGSLCSCTTSCMNLQASSDTLIVVLMGTKCTIHRCEATQNYP